MIRNLKINAGNMRAVKNILAAGLANIIMMPAVLMLFAGCDEDNIIYAEPQLAVEGWIDSGEHPIVLLSTTIQPSMEYQDMSVINDYAVRDAKVVVSDGQNDYGAV